MRRLMSFACAGDELAASLDGSGGRTGLLLVTGGSQTRVGSHRMYERLAKSLAELGYPCFRYDRRGVGDSGGEDPGFRGSGPDTAAAAATFRREIPGLERIFGLGLCDGATALALFGAEAGLAGLILVNPWLVEAEAGAPPPAAIRAHYRQRLLSREGWKKILSGAVDYRKLLTGLRRISAKPQISPLAAEQELKAPAFRGLVEGVQKVATDSHTFARPGDEAALLAATLRALEALAR
jgi:exosortase A-associated hydrolase 1